ncbi:SixA phosphatase family protein [Cumulibacter manganitolerans]|uniref:SixA phosphatase family protein n=1 Tax=Cumulibacter manganitolerans TaxID=1884992 RepID=UPI0018861BB7|nr:histidine phosphatase family protein [Cumulibacter manganitolerans]
MPTLILLRHAKTEPDAVDDWHRELTDRGRAQAHSIGARIAAIRDGARCTVMVSTALRAAQTWEEIAPALDPGVEVLELPSLYVFDERDVLRQIQERGGEAQTLVVIGHNPGISNLARLLIGEDLPDDGSVVKYGALRTCRAAALRVDGPWADLEEGRCTLRALLSPAVD